MVLAHYFIPYKKMLYGFVLGFSRANIFQNNFGLGLTNDLLLSQKRREYFLFR